MESIGRIYEQHSKTVYAFLLTKTKDPDLAEELTQETFFQAVQGIQSFQGTSTMSTWLCGIARNQLAKHIRKHAPMQSLDEMDEVQGNKGTESEVLLQWDSVQVLKLIHDLKEPMREVVYLRLVGNLSFGQIGEIIGKSENWARVNFYRGKEKIVKEALKYEG